MLQESNGGLVLTITLPLATMIKNGGGRYSSVVLSTPNILRPWVRIPSKSSMLFSIYIIEIVMTKGRKKQKDARIGPFLKRQW